jgi:CRP/FNR family transcriptional regulator
MLQKLRNVYLLKDVCDETLKEIAKYTSYLKLSKDNILFYEGEDSKCLYLLIKGIVKFYKTSSNNKEIIIKYYHSNEFIAEVSNLEHLPYPATGKSFTDIEVLKIDFGNLKHLLYSDANLALVIQTSLIRKIRTLENIIQLDVVLTSEERIAKYLCDYTKEFFNTKRLIIAEILNITPETLSRRLKIFENDRLIDYKNKTIDKERLKALFL